MSERDWTSIDAAGDELDSLVHSNDLPGDHAGTLRAVERCVRVLEGAEVATEKCASLRTAARTFYADRSRRSRPISDVNSKHQRMIEYVWSIRTHIGMLKAAEKK